MAPDTLDTNGSNHAKGISGNTLARIVNTGILCNEKVRKNVETYDSAGAYVKSRNPSEKPAEFTCQNIVYFYFKANVESGEIKGFKANDCIVNDKSIGEKSVLKY